MPQGPVSLVVLVPLRLEVDGHEPASSQEQCGLELRFPGLDFRLKVRRPEFWTGTVRVERSGCRVRIVEHVA